MKSGYGSRRAIEATPCEAVQGTDDTQVTTKGVKELQQALPELPNSTLTRAIDLLAWYVSVGPPQLPTAHAP